MPGEPTGRATDRPDGGHDGHDQWARCGGPRWPRTDRYGDTVCEFSYRDRARNVSCNPAARCSACIAYRIKIAKQLALQDSIGIPTADTGIWRPWTENRRLHGQRTSDARSTRKSNNRRWISLSKRLGCRDARRRLRGAHWNAFRHGLARNATDDSSWTPVSASTTSGSRVVTQHRPRTRVR